MKSEYYKTKESVKEYIELADGIDGQNIINKLLPFTNNKKTLLEIGSGPGKDYKILSNGFAVTGSDSSKEFISFLQKNNSNGDFLLLDASTLQTDKKFDVIYSNKVIQHLTDEKLKESITRQSDILNEGGVVCHTCWKGEGDEEFKGMYVNYYSNDNLKEMFSDKFEILLLENYEEFEADDSILIIAKKR